MRERGSTYSTGILRAGVGLAAVLLLAAIPKTTEITMISSRMKELSGILNLSLNRITSYRDNPRLPQLQRGSTPFRVVHIGDSHIQADFFTGEVRRLLASYYGDSTISVGYAFPYNLAGTNSPAHYTFGSHSHWQFRRATGVEGLIGAGLSGMVMETADDNPSLSVQLKGNGYFDEMVVFFESEGGECAVSVEGLPFEVRVRDTKHARITFKSPVSGANLQFGGRFAKLSVSGLVINSSAAGVVYSSAGLNGADAKSYLRAAELGHQLALIDPQLVVVSLGTNDAYHPLFDVDTFSATFSRLVGSIRRAAPGSTVLLTTPGDHFVQRTSPNPNLLAARDAIMATAIEHGCCVWDFHGLMGGEGSIALWSCAGLAAPDLVHLNAKGYRLQGQLFFEALTANR